MKNESKMYFKRRSITTHAHFDIADSDNTMGSQNDSLSLDAIKEKSLDYIRKIESSADTIQQAPDDMVNDILVDYKEISLNKDKLLNRYGEILTSRYVRLQEDREKLLCLQKVTEKECYKILEEELAVYEKLLKLKSPASLLINSILPYFDLNKKVNEVQCQLFELLDPYLVASEYGDSVDDYALAVENENQILKTLIELKEKLGIEEKKLLDSKQPNSDYLLKY